MKLSLDWLSEFVDLDDLDPERIGGELSLRTAEVEGVEEVRRRVEGVVVAEVLECEPLAGEPRLRRVRVGLGGRTAQTVCGAPNVRPGMRAAFAGVGCVLKGGAEVEPTQLHGVPSEGVLCSPAELGIGTNHERLLELPPETEPGRDLSRDCPPRDVLFEVDNKSLTHRPDLWGQYGFARELAAIFERPLRPYETADLSELDHLEAVPIEVEDHGDCPVYTGLLFAVEPGLPAPLKIQRRLTVIGSTCRSGLVDLTNYVQAELGQPTHAFDADAGVDSIRVARAGEARPFRTLDGEAWELEPQDLLIYSGDRAVALAGIMGGAESEVRATTRRVLLESANFDATRIRRTSMRLGLRTEASRRFEKKLPPVYARTATERLFSLARACGLSPQPASAHTVVGDLQDRPRKIAVPAGGFSRWAGTDIPDRRAAEILERIGFASAAGPDGGLEVSVPPFRSERDVGIPADLAEEVMRLFGYDRISPRLPVAALEPAPLEPTVRGHHRQRRLLTQAHGFVEIHTYGWLDDAWAETLGHGPERPLRLQNPPSEGRGVLRDSLLPNLLAFVRDNRRLRDDFRVLELGKVFWAGDGGESREGNRLAGISVHQSGEVELPEHFRSVRTALDHLARVAALPPLRFDLATGGGGAWADPDHLLSVRLGEEEVGLLGVLAPAVASEVLDRGHAVWFDLRPDLLAGEPYPRIRYRQPPTHPGSWQDFTIAWDRESRYEELAALLDRFEHPLLVAREFRDLFAAPDEEKSNYTFRFHIRAPGETLTSDEIDSFRDSLVRFLERAGCTLA